MAGTDSLAKHYGLLSGKERFHVVIEAMSRGDRVEQARLDDSCPRYNYEIDDQQFRRRIQLAFELSAMVALDLRAGLAEIRAAARFCLNSDSFAKIPSKISEAVFLYGWAYGRKREGTVEWSDVPEPEDIAREVEARPEFGEAIREAREFAEMGTAKVAEWLLYATLIAHAEKVLTLWDGYSRFCRKMMETEPMTVMGAWGLADRDPGEEVRTVYPEAEVDEAQAEAYAERLARPWRARFGGG